MSDSMQTSGRSSLAAFLLGAAGSGVLLIVLLFGLVWRESPPGQATAASLIALLLVAAFAWPGMVLWVFPRAPQGAPAAGFASIWAGLGLLGLIPAYQQFMAYLFASFIFLILGRLGAWVMVRLFPERFRAGGG